MWKIDKVFEFDYGHRVWSQTLIPEYCGNEGTKCVCRHLHGHRGHVQVFLSGKALEAGMVTDFKHLGWLKKFLDEFVDHKFIIDSHDPMYKKMVSTTAAPCVKCSEIVLGNFCSCCGTRNMKYEPKPLEPIFVPGTKHLAGYRLPAMEQISNTADAEVQNGYLVVDFVPTSENLAKWLFDIVQSKMHLIGVQTHKIEWFETPKSRAAYVGQDLNNGLEINPAGSKLDSATSTGNTGDTKISDIIRNRILNSGARYFSNDNISRFISSAEEYRRLEIEIAKNFENVLRSMVVDLEKDHNVCDTPKRIAKMYVREVFGGRYLPQPSATSFPNAMSYKSLYIVGPISIRSTCAHHFQNIVGKCWIGILPGDDVIGLSKFNRNVDWIASRPQIQEEMTVQIADFILHETKAKGVVVLVDASHLCVVHRGVKEHTSNMKTFANRGEHISEEKFVVLLAQPNHSRM